MSVKQDENVEDIIKTLQEVLDASNLPEGTAKEATEIMKRVKARLTLSQGEFENVKTEVYNLLAAVKNGNPEATSKSMTSIENWLERTRIKENQGPVCERKSLFVQPEKQEEEEEEKDN